MDAATTMEISPQSSTAIDVGELIKSAAAWRVAPPSGRSDQPSSGASTQGRRNLAEEAVGSAAIVVGVAGDGAG